VVTVNITVSWDVAPCSLVDIYRRFGGTFAYSFTTKTEAVFIRNISKYPLSQKAVISVTEK
jgi:hypothetical protein